MTGRASRALVASFVALVAAFAVVGPATAQAACDPIVGPSAEAWPAPLDRPVTFTLHARGLRVRDAIERVADAVGIRVSYSDDLLPAKPIECIAFVRVPAGDALRALVATASLEPVVASADHVVLSPRPVEWPAEKPARVEPEPASNAAVIPLDRVLVMGERPRATSAPPGVDVKVIDGRELAARSSGSLADALNGAVPGLWLWRSAGGGGLVDYASVRGASSFAANAPKIYIDDIEVADPRLLSRLSPDIVERVEVIRGPQGAALYGADAIAGVIHIVTRPGRPGPARAQLRSTVGAASTAFANAPALEHDHTLGLGAAWDRGTAALDLSLGTAGAAVDGASARRVGADGSARWIGERSIIGATLRFADDESVSPISPLIANGSATKLSSRIRQYTVGLNATFATNSAWTHEAVIGIDRYRMRGATPDLRALGFDGAAVPDADGMRATARLSSATPVGLGSGATGHLTLTLDHALLRTRPVGSAGDAVAVPDVDRVATGLSGRLDATLLDGLTLSGGLRVEYVGDGAGTTRFAALPMLAGAWDVTDGPVDVRLRAAYGTAIRWPALPTRERWPHAGPLSTDALGPERQSGIETGVDVSLGSRLRLGVTRFDQIASGLAAPPRAPLDVGLTGHSAPGDIAPRTSAHAIDDGGGIEHGIDGASGIVHAAPRAGSISNRGWELSAELRHGPLTVNGSLAIVDSRVLATASGYAGELVAGDRMLGVPARMMSLSATWSDTRWSASATAARAADWIGYDYIALASAAEDGHPPAGAELRDFWTRYNGNTRIRLAASHELRPGLSFFLAADNLLGAQLGEPDNITIMPGTTFSVGLKAILR